MSGKIVIENISKQYAIGARKTEGRTTFKEAVRAWASKGGRLLGGGAGSDSGSPSETFWALKDVGFEVAPGEVLGIIGPNGAGKSTLLKILSRITEPTTGRIEAYGTLTSLLEVGTGFHPDLTGRENIFLNGAILGMSHREIRAKFSGIVEFSGVDKFLDTPVKHYSSGMYVRLAFAVAAHLDPEILVIDEVLAVGDAAFQKKCLGKIRDVATGRRSVVFVSHNFLAIRSLCTRLVLIDRGKIVAQGGVDEVLTIYHKMLAAPRDLSGESLANRAARSSPGCPVRFTSFSMLDGSGAARWTFTGGESLRLRASYIVKEDVPSLRFYIVIRSVATQEVVTSAEGLVSDTALRAGASGWAELELPEIPLRAGDYALTLYWASGDLAATFDALDDNVGIPWLTIVPKESGLHRNIGYFSIPARIKTG